MTRKQHKDRSNNKQNHNKNVCALAVAKTLKSDDDVRYLHTIQDLVRATRKNHTVRSRLSSVKGKSVGAARQKLEQLSKDVPNCQGFIIRVEGHALLLNTNGQTVTDTAKRKRDRRKMTHCYIVYN